MSKLISNHTDITIRGTNIDNVYIDDGLFQNTKESLLELLKEELGEEEYGQMLEEELRRYKIETSPLYKVLNDG